MLPPNHRSNAPGERPFVHAPPFRVVIPTRDSSATIGVFLDAYRKIGIEPIYILDARSVDDSARVLKRMNATVHEFTPDRNFAEAGMLAHAVQFIDTEWALRMDDDEFPSIELIRWLSARGACLEKDVCALSRRELFSYEGKLQYTKIRNHFWLPDNPAFLNPHFRFYRPRNVKYVSQIHTPGFVVEASDFAPQEAYFIHCDTLVRTLAQRIEKLQRYDDEKPGSGWGMGRLYLPEFFAAQELNLSPLESDEFREIFASLPPLSEAATVEIDPRKFRQMLEGPR